MDRNTNSVHITGNVHATNSAIAANKAQVTQVTNSNVSAVPADADSINRALVELAGRIRGHTGELTDAEDLAATAERAATEVAEDQPNKHVLAGLMHSIGKAVGGIGTLARTVSAIQDAINSFVGS